VAKVGLKITNPTLTVIISYLVGVDEVRQADIKISRKDCTAIGLVLGQQYYRQAYIWLIISFYGLILNSYVLLY
jgi:hypothetical protein